MLHEKYRDENNSKILNDEFKKVQILLEKYLIENTKRTCQKICVNEIYHQNGTRSFPNSMAS